MVEATTTLSLIDFIADRYGIDLLDAYRPDSVEFRRHHSSGPEFRKKLIILKRLHSRVDDYS